MIDLNSMALFVGVVEQSGFSQAARKLGIPKATVSRKVAELEADLGTVLLQRTTRKLYLTEAGSLYFQRCRRLLDEIEETNRAVTSLQSVPQGTLRLTAPVIFGMRYLGAWIGEFLQRYAEISVEVLVTNQSVDLVNEGIDVAFSWQRQPLKELPVDARVLYRVSYWVCASRNYLQRYGEPQTPQELALHRCIVAAPQPSHSLKTWQLVDSSGIIETVSVSSVLVTNDLMLARQAAIAGSGIAYLPNSILSEPIATGELQRVLPSWAFREGTLYLYCLGQPPLPAKVRTFCDFIREKSSKVNV